MSETGFVLFQYLVAGIETVLYVVCMTLFFRPFMAGGRNRENVFFDLYEQYPVFIGLVPLVSILFYVGIVATVMSYQEMLGLQAESGSYEEMEQYIAKMDESMDVFEITIKTGNPARQRGV